jgi:hypothetical protein
MFLTWVFDFFFCREKEGEGERCRARWCVEGVEVYCYIQVELLMFVVLYVVPLPLFLLLVYNSVPSLSVLFVEPFNVYVFM